MRHRTLTLLSLVALVGMLLFGCATTGEGYIYQSVDKAVTVVSANPVPADMSKGFTFNVTLKLPRDIPGYRVWVYPEVFYSDDDDGPGDHCVSVWYLPSEIVAPVTSTIRRGGWISYYKDGTFTHALKGTVSVWTIAVGYVNEDDVFVHVLEDTFEYTVQI